MSEKILFVDDEQHILSSFRRTLRKNWNFVTALGGEMALEIFKSKGPFAVVVSDMKMPGMSGIQLLSKIKEIDPDTIRIMLTGNADLMTAMEAVNEGNVYRFLTKPCSTDILNKALEQAVWQHKLIKSEQELLNKTLKGSIQILIEILSMTNQKSFKHATKLREYVRRLTRAKIISSAWEIEISALLARIGETMVPADVLEKARKNETLSETEQDMMLRIPRMGYELVKKIPRLEAVAKIILYQNKLFNGDGYPLDDVKGIDIPLGSRVLRILNDLITLESEGHMKKEASDIMLKRTGSYDSNLLQTIIGKGLSIADGRKPAQQETMSVNLSELDIGVVLIDNIETHLDQVLMISGQEITHSHLMRIKNWSKIYKIKEPIRILRNIY